MAISRYYLTLPIDAMPYNYNNRLNDSILVAGELEGDGIPNEMLFPGRHTYQLSTPESRGDLDWLIVKGHSNTLLPDLRPNDAILTEKTVYSRPSEVQSIRPGAKTIDLDITLRANSKEEWDDIRIRRMGYLLGADLMTLRDFCSSTAIGSVNLQPDYWYITYETSYLGQIKRFSIPIFGFWLSNDNANSDNGFTLDTTLTCWSNGFTWYGETQEYELSYVADDTYAIDPEVLNPTSCIVIGDPLTLEADTYVHRGTTRSHWELEFTAQGGGNPIEIVAFGIADVTANEHPGPDYTGSRWARLRHINYPTGGWVVPDGATVALRTADRHLFHNGGGPTAIMGQQIDIAQNGLGGVWERMQFAPGRRYRVFIETTTPVAIDNSGENVGIFRVIERFGGV